MLKALKIGR